MDYFSLTEGPPAVVLESENRCETCGKLFKKKSKLNRHIRETHLNLKEHVCNFCEKKFKRNSHLKRHLVIHDKYHLERHIKVKHTYEFRLKCEHCSLSFDKKISLHRHAFQVHCKPKPYECKECGKGFFKSFLLNKHQACHASRERKLSFSSKAASKRGRATSSTKPKSESEQHNEQFKPNQEIIPKHEIFNEDDHPFDERSDSLWLRKFSFSERLSPQIYDEHPFKDCASNPCQEQEIQPNELKLNKKLSNQASLFICFYENCQKVYTTPYNLKTHIRTKHLKSKDYLCKFCKASFYHGKSLREHLKKKHKASEGEEDSKLLEPTQSENTPQNSEEGQDKSIIPAELSNEGDKL